MGDCGAGSEISEACLDVPDSQKPGKERCKNENKGIGGLIDHDGGGWMLSDALATLTSHINQPHVPRAINDNLSCQ